MYQELVHRITYRRIIDSGAHGLVITLYVQLEFSENTTLLVEEIARKQVKQKRFPPFCFENWDFPNKVVTCNSMLRHIP